MPRSSRSSLPRSNISGSFGRSLHRPPGRSLDRSVDRLTDRSSTWSKANPKWPKQKVGMLEFVSVAQSFGRSVWVDRSVVRSIGDRSIAWSLGRLIHRSIARSIDRLVNLSTGRQAIKHITEIYFEYNSRPLIV